jgi:hypothetical protein
MNSVAAFALLSLILTVTPGPDSLLVLRSTLRAGRHAGTRVAGGAASGSLFWGPGDQAVGGAGGSGWRIPLPHPISQPRFSSK